MSRKSFDCVQVKRRAQRALRRALADKTPEEQADEIGRRAEQNPIWQQLLRRKPGAPIARKAGVSGARSRSL